MGSFSISFDTRGFPNPKITLNFTIHFPVKDPKVEPKVRFYKTTCQDCIQNRFWVPSKLQRSCKIIEDLKNRERVPDQDLDTCP